MGGSWVVSSGVIELGRTEQIHAGSFSKIRWIDWVQTV